MRVMVLVKADERSETEASPTRDELAEMGKFNDQLVKAGVMLAADGLKPSSAGKRVRFDADNRSSVIDGPFAESKELVAGFWIWEVSSLEEAVEWLQRSPFRGTEVEIRPIWEAEEFDATFNSERREADQRQHDEIPTSEQ